MVSGVHQCQTPAWLSKHLSALWRFALHSQQDDAARVVHTEGQHLQFVAGYTSRGNVD